MWRLHDELTGVFGGAILVIDGRETIAPKWDPATLLVSPAGIRFPRAVIAAGIVARQADVALSM